MSSVPWEQPQVRIGTAGDTNAGASLVLTLGVAWDTSASSSLDLAVSVEEGQGEDTGFTAVIPAGLWEVNSLIALRDKLNHLAPERQEEFCSRLGKYPRVFGNALLV